VRIDHYLENDPDFQYDFPGDTYAYTTTTPLVIEFDRMVSLESIWLRLHRSPSAYMKKTRGPRNIKMLAGGKIVAESTFLFTSDEWLLLKPSQSGLHIIGDTLVIQGNTDVDSININFGGGIEQ
jgi:hypothetical protein